MAVRYQYLNHLPSFLRLTSLSFASLHAYVFPASTLCITIWLLTTPHRHFRHSTYSFYWNATQSVPQYRCSRRQPSSVLILACWWLCCLLAAAGSFDETLHLCSPTSLGRCLLLWLRRVFGFYWRSITYTQTVARRSNGVRRVGRVSRKAPKNSKGRMLEGGSSSQIRETPKVHEEATEWNRYSSQ